jgi:hypothetical protein
MLFKNTNSVPEDRHFCSLFNVANLTQNTDNITNLLHTLASTVAAVAVKATGKYCLTVLG